VLDSRKDDKTEYWLKHIESFGGDSPVLIVINKTDQNHAFDVDRKSLLRKYKNIKGFYRISCQSGEGIAAFEKALKKEIPGVELLRTEVAESWLQVKEKLEKVTSEHNYISDGTFIDICREQGITEESVRETLIEFLNELGIVLHFKRLTLNDFHVLNPCWVTEAVYKIINSPYLAQNNGILAEKKLGFVLNEETAKNEPLDLSLNIPYQGREQGYILSLMQEFELCYTYGRGKILIPDLLPHYEPAFKPPDKKPLEFLIRYDFLPKSIMPRFIVKSHGDIEGELRWRTGVVLANKDFKTRALVRADEEDKTIYIRISGTRRRDHLTVIRHTFREINERFENLDYKELITLPIPAKVSEKFGGEEKVPAEYRRTVSYRFLLGYEAGGKANYFEGETGVSYPVAELLDSVVGKEERLIEMGVGSAGTGRDKDRLEDDIREKYEIKLQKKDEEHRAAAKKMAELKARIKKEKKLKGVCDKLAEKKARKSVWRFVFINLFVLAAWLAALILIDWEKMGRFAILTAPLAAVFHMAYYAIFGKKFNSEESKKRRLEDEKETQYALHRFSEEDYQALQKQLEALEHPI
jgi:GTPase SAR1 family protein